MPKFSLIPRSTTRKNSQGIMKRATTQQTQAYFGQFKIKNSSKYKSTTDIPFPETHNEFLKTQAFEPVETLKAKQILMKDCHNIHSLVIKPLYFLLLSIVTLSLYILGIKRKYNFYLSIIFFVLTLSNIFFVILEIIKRRRNRTRQTFIPVTQYQPEFDLQNPYLKFVKDNSAVVPLPTAVSNAALDLYRPFVPSDRPTASILSSVNTLSIDTSIDQLAADSLRSLALTDTEYGQYLLNFKTFISNIILKKLVKELHTDSHLIEAIISLPAYENHREYVIERIKKLAASQYLAGHFGDRGDRFKDSEWNSEMPSDNQILMHVFGTWLSYFMSHNKKHHLTNIFKTKFVTLKRDPVLETTQGQLLCVEDWVRFYVLARDKKTGHVRRFWAFPGRDSMYSALVIFFYLIKRDENNILDCADLQVEPICMDRVFSMSRFE